MKNYVIKFFFIALGLQAILLPYSATLQFREYFFIIIGIVTLAFGLSDGHLLLFGPKPEDPEKNMIRP